MIRPTPKAITSTCYTSTSRRLRSPSPSMSPLTQETSYAESLSRTHESGPICLRWPGIAGSTNITTLFLISRAVLPILQKLRIPPSRLVGLSVPEVLPLQLTDILVEDKEEVPALARSASVREPTKASNQGTPSPVGALNHQPGKLVLDDDADSAVRRRNVNRHTIQPEYVEPRSHTSRAEAPTVAPATAARGRSGSQGLAGTGAPLASRSKPLPQEPSGSNEGTKVAGYTTTPPSNSQQRMPPPTRPARDVPRSASDSTGVFSVPTSQPSTSQSKVTRPSTGTAPPTSSSASASIRADPRLPTRGSYGQPVAPTVEAANAHGRVTQPSNGRGYNISAPMPQHGPTRSISRVPVPVRNNDTTAQVPEPTKSHHRRSSTLSGLSEKLFGKSGSFMGGRQQGDGGRGKKEKKYPPTSMKEPYVVDNPPRTSTESKRSFSFGIGKKRSVDLESQQQPEEKPRRFSSLIPSSFSLRGLTGVSKEADTEIEPPVPQAVDFPQPPRSAGGQKSPSAGQGPSPSIGQGHGEQTGSRQRQLSGRDGRHDQAQPARTNFSRPPQYHPAPSQVSNDVYGSTGVYSESDGAYPQTSYAAPVAGQAQYGSSTNQTRPLYPEGFNNQDGASRASMQQNRSGRGVLQKNNNRNFNLAYEHEQGPSRHEGSSGPARKVMDYFRRRKARVDSNQ